MRCSKASFIALSLGASDFPPSDKSCASVSTHPESRSSERISGCLILYRTGRQGEVDADISDNAHRKPQTGVFECQS